MVKMSSYCIVPAKTGDPSTFLESKTALCLYYPLLALITVLTAARRAKLRQIADRWFTLREMLRARNVQTNWRSIEDVVCDGFERKGLRARRYWAEDFFSHLALSSIFYALLLLVACHIIHAEFELALFVVSTILVHFVWSCFWLLRPVWRTKAAQEPTTVTLHELTPSKGA